MHDAAPVKSPTGLVGSKIPDQDPEWSGVDPAISKITNLLRATPEKAAIQICNAIEKPKRSSLYY